MSQPFQVIRRTFEAAKHPKGSSKRAKLNSDVETSEYYPSQPWLLRRNFLMSDGTPHPTQQFIDSTFRTRRDAVEAAA